MGVVEEAEILARAYGVDVREARLAGLLHDWDKAYDDEEIRERVRELGLRVNPWILEHQPRLLHGPTAAAALGREYPAIPAGILQAIERHTTGEIDMTPLDMVLYCADALEPNRRFGRVDELRAQIGRVTLEELYVAVLGYWTILIIEQGKTLHPRTVDIWNAYAVKNEKPYINAKRKERK
ncbi:HD domain-containing protein [Ellagibacter isourolithinifaciens]|uniref:bis(5'-nucleosyl)-tetraphosphatase (symmetrical) n=2 Tax=Ellagibacter isourolithinifaciens TaxID=2137581 RepID=A0A6N6NN73_9ACTN|nr:HD domain-containing protein [Ellagibacter isourolithinifaciens]